MATNFVLLMKGEIRVKLKKLANAREKVCVWQKGTKRRDWLMGYLFGEDQLWLEGSNLDFVSGHLGEEVLFTSEVEGLPIFGKAKIFPSKTGYVLGSLEEVYKCERRKDFRLLAYPGYNVYAGVPVEEFKLQVSSPKVLNFQKSTSKEQTELFKAFVALINSSGKSDGGNQENAEALTQFRVLDVSVNGLSFRISDFERPFFENLDTPFELKLHFEETLIEIPSAKKVYFIPFFDYQGSYQQNFKVGVRFVDLPDAVRSTLIQSLYAELSKFEKEEFEEYLK